MKQTEKELPIWKMMIMLLLCTTVTAFNEEVKIRFSISEEQPIGSIVGTIIKSLVEFDNGFRKLSNFILVQSSYSSLFLLDLDSSVLSVNQRIDREEICDNLDEISENCVLALQVICKSFNKEFEVISIEVVIMDINDNSPIFPTDNLPLKVAEDLQIGSKFLIPSAQDFDSKDFDIAFYTVENCNDCRFTLDVDTSEIKNPKLFIRSNDRLNRERNPISFDIIAEDKGNPPKRGRLRVIINIEETNQPPYFVNSTYVIEVFEESLVPQPIVKIKAFDFDKGNNGKIEYFFEKSNIYGNLIVINAKTGNVYIKNKLDYENKKEYKMKVIAKDMANPSLSASCLLIIHVIDKNDHAPKVTLTSEKKGDRQLIEVLENVQETQTVAFLSVSDEDQGLNANVSCRISNHYDLFSLSKIHFNIYSVSTLSPFDRESNPFYTIEVLCVDMGEPPLETIFDFNVNVSDQNDNNPYFIEQVYRSEVFENSPKGTYLLDVAAVDSDIDVNGEVRYILEDKMYYNGLVILDDVTGVLKTGHRSLDYETNTSISFKIEARDLGNPPLSSFTNVIIEVLDTNDNPPKFQNLFNTLHIKENESPKSFIHRFETIDQDLTDIYQETRYELSCCNMSGKTCNVLKEIFLDPGEKEEKRKFLEYYTEEQLQSTVVLEGNKLLSNSFFDREVESVYHFCIHAINTHTPFLFSIAYVTLEIDDVNDNSPSIVFPSSSYILELSSWTSIDENLLQIIARDPDIGDNSLLHFSLLQNKIYENSATDFSNVDSRNKIPETVPLSSLFSINATTGMIVLKKNLRETDYWNDTSLIINFTVSDSGIHKIVFIKI